MAPTDRLQQVREHLVGGAPSNKDPTRVDGHVILITGGAQGIGKAAADLLARQGAKIAINDVDAAKAKAAADELQAAGCDAFFLAGDLLDEAFPERLVNAVVARFGRINCLINNAGFCVDSAVHKMTDAKFDIIMKIHNYTPFRMIRALSSHWMDPANLDMPKSIINISSTSGLHGAMGQINYSTAKAGIIGMTKTIAAEWGRYNVRCNAVAYGWIDTRITRPPDGSETVALAGQEIVTGIPLSAKKWRDVSDIPLQRPGTTSDAAGVLLFLASPLASYVTGTCVECTGGRYL
ncbi:short-chain dehydrogenase/reductase SDR [Zalerion maritima]|uniref:Short-chain dehydrogenase/reductase SDR n=1 Tax=Zalerion maritima TaxID=339359 RepID=A0AAD5RFE4_9PEZI|nr:short-chain dehydrogenase/reductase SDR [Zalerion maritima]